MNRRIIWAIARKDWKEVRQNGMAWKPMLILPLIICVILPVIFILGPTLFNMPVSSFTKGQDIKAMVASLPPAVQEQVGGMTDHQLMIYFLLAFTFAPMFLILPIMTASIIGSDSFVGEKERKTMESLLYTPATERELFHLDAEGRIIDKTENGGPFYQLVTDKKLTPRSLMEAYGITRPRVPTKNGDDAILETYLKHANITGHLQSFRIGR